MKYMTVKEWLMTLPESMRKEHLPIAEKCAYHSSFLKIKVNRLSKAIELGYNFNACKSGADYWNSFWIAILWAEGSKRYLGEGKWR